MIRAPPCARRSLSPDISSLTRCDIPIINLGSGTLMQRQLDIRRPIQQHAPQLSGVSWPTTRSPRTQRALRARWRQHVFDEFDVLERAGDHELWLLGPCLVCEDEGYRRVVGEATWNGRKEVRVRGLRWAWV